MQVVLVQEASSLDPAVNRGRLEALVPDGADLVVLPEAFARDFGEPGSDLAPYAEPLDGPFVDRGGAGRRASAARRWWRGCSSEAGERAVQHRSSCAAARSADYRKIHLYDSFGYRESDVLAAGPIEPLTFELDGTTVGLMTCYDLRFPELARRSSTRAPRCSSCRRPGSPGRARSTTGRRCCGPGRSRTPCTSSASASRAPATPATRWWSARSATCWSRAATAPRSLHAELDPATVAEARRTNPSLANRRL